MKNLIRFFAALVALFALYSIRAWFVLGGAFFGVMFVRVGVEQMLYGDDWPAGAFITVLGFVFLVISYRWFAERWNTRSND